MKPRTNVCVRAMRDAAQIRRCQEQIRRINEDATAFAGLLKLAGNPVRMKILWLLNEEERLCVCDLAEILGMTAPAVSQHLKKLHNGGLIDRIQEGVTIYYFLKKNARPLLHALFEWIPAHPNVSVAP